MEENKEFDDINLDDFNFDFELSSNNEEQEKSTNENVNNDFADLSMEDFNFDEFTEVSVVNENERQEPFFEQTLDDDTLEQNISNDDFQTADNAFVDNEIVEEDSSFVVDASVLNNDEKKTFDPEFIETEVVSQEDYSEELIEKEDQAEISENVVDDNTKAEEEVIFEGNLVDEVIAENQEQVYPEMDNHIDMTAEEVEAAHGEYFAENGEVARNDDNALINDYVPTSFIESIEKSGNLGYLKWYSGLSSDKVFEFGRDSDSATFNATDDCKTIHVNVGYDTYGWEVQFSDGIVMNLRDVREYQIRNGCLPNSEGRIVYGQVALMFSGVERILVYERVRYFSYGV
ncbi:MAG: hypothetical protein E7020_03145 [Alphaproteobacteria bacterium]|nr:hypothetical protein [Alphaproteobacteria bacterium]